MSRSGLLSSLDRFLQAASLYIAAEPEEHLQLQAAPYRLLRLRQGTRAADVAVQNLHQRSEWQTVRESWTL